MDNKLRWSAILIFSAIGVSIVLCGGVLLWLGGQTSQITCVRLTNGQVNCEVVQTYLWLIPSRSYTLNNVVATEIKTRCNGDNCSYAVNITSENDSIPFSPAPLTNIERVQPDQAYIDAFLTSSDPMMQYTSRPGWSLVRFASFCICFGLIIFGIAFGRKLIVIFRQITQ